MSDTHRPTGEPLPGFTPPPPPGPARIEGRFVTLERLDPARHIDAIWRAGQGADWIWDYLGYGPFAAAADYRAWADGVASGSDPCFYTIISGGCALGVASFLRIGVANGVAEIGHILLTPPLQRTPAASEALMLMVRWAFENGYRRFEWKCDALNAPSRRAAIRLGFTFEGIFRKHMIYKGRNRDTAWFSITDDEWPALRGAYDAWLNPANFDAEGQQRESLSALTARALPGRG
ncbi:MAG: GNAT family protein [Paracoccus sp. (in: a-proteobacteria)]|uniref:GNAT family N-acetyltransferase n=1 Tax=Paracoccus sp. TaxID=267 RepID=UPI0026DFEBF4|nr:GNAT family protein [Paracoccus sp. (in: a-proteobacteria)]MDO5632696.1 GNAT family protein [Paracoccus sp. (in: a-proteobacteria)]